jgi:hypothetical protein
VIQSLLIVNQCRVDRLSVFAFSFICYRHNFSVIGNHDFRCVKQLAAFFFRRVDMVSVDEFDGERIGAVGVSGKRVIFAVIFDGECFRVGAAVCIDALSREFLAVTSRFVGSCLALHCVAGGKLGFCDVQFPSSHVRVSLSEHHSRAG